MRIFLVSLFFFGAFAQSLSSQNVGVIQQVILYKDYPYYVNVTNQGDITEFIRTAPEVMKGQIWDKNAIPPMPLGIYNKPQPKAVAVYNSPLNNTVIGDGTDIVMDTNEAPGKAMDGKVSNDSNVSFKPKNEKPMKTTVIQKQAPVEEAPEISFAERDEVEKNKFSYDMEFQGFTARLTPELINVLEDIVKVYKQDENKSLEIRSFVTTGDDTNKKLAKNRMDACKDLLVNYGIPSEKITTGIRPYRSSQSGQVNISFVE